MPTYGYQCAGCSDAFEVMQKITDNALTTCEKCGGELRKKVFPVGIVFKGSGFYVNDYARKGADDAPKSDTQPAEAKAADAAATSGAGDTNAAKPAETAPAASAPESKPAADAKPAAPAAPSAAAAKE